MMLVMMMYESIGFTKENHRFRGENIGNKSENRRFRGKNVENTWEKNQTELYSGRAHSRAQHFWELFWGQYGRQK